MVSTHLKISQIGSCSPKFRDDSSTKSLTATTTKPTIQPKKKTSPNLSIKGCSRSWLLWSPPLGKKHPQVVVESVVEIFPRVGFSGEKTSGFWKILWWGWSKVMTFTSWWNTTSWIRSLYMYLLIHSLRSWKWGFWQKNGGSFFNYILSVNWNVYLQEPIPHPTSPQVPRSNVWPVWRRVAHFRLLRNVCHESPKRTAFRANWAQRRHQMIPWECWNLPVVLPKKRKRFFDEDVEGCCLGAVSQNLILKNQEIMQLKLHKVLAPQCFGDTPMWFSLWRVDDHPYHPKAMGV